MDGLSFAREGSMDLHMTNADKARAAFIIGIKRFVNVDIAARLRKDYSSAIAPKLEAAQGRPLDDFNRDDRKAAKAELEQEPLYKSWAALTYLSQDMMWDCVEGVLRHDLPRLQHNADRLSQSNGRLGSLTLNPDLELPRNIAMTEIHRQPGGFCYEANDRDITAGARYNGAGMMYSAGKGRTAVAGQSGGDFVKGVIDERWPGFKPRRILEVGCGTGRNTPSYKRLYPDAEVVAIDCAPGLLRFAHAYAEAEGTAIDFIQMDITAMDFPDGSFDLVASHIVGHETTHAGLPKMIAECYRVLAPGGIALHVDVPSQPENSKLFDQVLNDWQVRYNGEPFWMGWADADVRGHMREAGFADADMIAEAIRRDDGGAWFCHGGRKG
jgi:ubiquinone/menaquinone biosynthesis C-methylase UbiE